MSEEWDEIEVMPYCNDGNKEYLREHLERVANAGLGPWEVSVIEAIRYDYGQVRTKEELARRAFAKNLDRNPKKAADTVERCFAERWIQFLTVEFLDQLQRELTVDGYLMPNGLIGQHYVQNEPAAGLISFTDRGASLYQLWIEFDPSAKDVEHWCVVDDADGFCVAYGTTLDECEFPVNESAQVVVERETAVQIGRWCDRWWNRFERGFRIRYRTSDEWRR